MKNDKRYFIFILSKDRTKKTLNLKKIDMLYDCVSIKLKTDRPRPNWIETALKSHGDDASNKV